LREYYLENYLRLLVVVHVGGRMLVLGLSGLRRPDRKLISHFDNFPVTIGTCLAFEQMIANAENLRGAQSFTTRVQPQLIFMKMVADISPLGIEDLRDLNAYVICLIRAAGIPYLAENDRFFRQFDLNLLASPKALCHIQA
jgi:hypothetical protein